MYLFGMGLNVLDTALPSTIRQRMPSNFGEAMRGYLSVEISSTVAANIGRVIVLLIYIQDILMTHALENYRTLVCI